MTARTGDIGSHAAVYLSVASTLTDGGTMGFGGTMSVRGGTVLPFTNILGTTVYLARGGTYAARLYVHVTAAAATQCTFAIYADGVIVSGSNGGVNTPTYSPAVAPGVGYSGVEAIVSISSAASASVSLTARTVSCTQANSQAMTNSRLIVTQIGVYS